MKCSSSNPKAQRAASKFPQRLQEIHEGRIVLRDDAVYKGNKKPVEVKCTVCGHEWEALPSNLISNVSGCLECAKEKQRNVVGVRKAPRASKAEQELARCMRSAGMHYSAISRMLRRDAKTIRLWCDPAQLEKSRIKCRRITERDKKSGHKNRLARAYYQTPNGKASSFTWSHKRRGLEYHALDTILIDGCWHEVNMWEYITTAEDREFWSFAGADDDVAKRKQQQIKLAAIAGEPYSLEHLVPLSRGGIHHPMNFANRALALNLQKSNSLWSKDLELFCARLFN